jgi:phosphatidate cytidylyltransferase
MKKILKRLIVFFTGFPALLLIIVFLPQYNHLCLNMVIFIFTVLGAVEFRNILVKKNQVISTSEAIILGAVSPAVWVAVVSFGAARAIVPCVFILGALWLLVSRVFLSQEKLDSYTGRITAGFALMIYPGLFLAWIIRMALFHEAGKVILVYFLLVYLNDAFAWVAGNLFGKNNRGFVPVSPNKSIAGFIGGLAASTFIGIAAAALLPGSFTSTLIPSTHAGALLGLGAGAAAILGDLGESAIKRSAGVKDSGTLILGRGGVLDSIDSLALAAPVYYLIYRVLFQ